jgi:S1-C subfamily serine protease
MCIKNLTLLFYICIFLNGCDLIPPDSPIKKTGPDNILPPSPDDEDIDLANKLMEATVTVYVFDEFGNEISIGSGAFVKSNVIATNYHVIKNGYVFKVKTYKNDKLIDAEIYKIDKEHDLTLLETSISNEKKPLIIQSNLPKQNTKIMVCGSPKGLDGTLSDGIVSAIRRSDPFDFDLIQITAPVSEGSSGGPVVNMNGEIIGIIVSSVKSGQNLNFAIPADYLEFLLR